MKDILSSAPPSAVHLNGHIGEKLDTVVRARIMSDKAAREIMPEAVAAFRNRVDDRLHECRGLWQGEFWGKWVLSAIAAQRYTQDAQLRKLIERAVRELLDTQDSNGYIGTYHDSGRVIAETENGNWNIWCRKYTLWGLLEAYELLEDPGILMAAQRFMDHLTTEVGPGRIEIRDTGAFEGLPSTSMLGPVVMLYHHTGERKYLDYALYIVDQWSFRKGEPPDILNKGLTGSPVCEWFPEPEKWAKAYELLSCVEGMIELYRATGTEQFLESAKNIYKNIQDHDLTIVGNVSKNDKFLGARFLPETESEVCDAIYWQRLSAQLLRLTGDPQYMDDIECTMYNSLCAAANREGTWATRRLLLSGEHWPAPQHCQLELHHCCVANLPRALLQLSELAVMTSEDAVVVNLYIESKATITLPSGNRIAIDIDTDYPRTGNIAITVTPDTEEEFEMKFRIPGWTPKATLKAGDDSLAATPGEYDAIRRQWKHGDRIELVMDMFDRIVEFPDGKQPYIAVMHGPLVLARDIRLGHPGIHEELDPLADGDGRIALTPMDPPADVWMAFSAPLRSGKTMALCDYSSAGNTWSRQTSDFKTWLKRTPRR